MDYVILRAEESLLTVAHFGISRRSAELIGAAAIVLDDERTLAQAVRSIAEKISGTPRIILCIPPVCVAQRLVSLPFDDLRKVREVLPAHLQGEVALPVEELAVEVMAAAESRFLALWARKNELRAIISLFSEAGLEPHIVSCMPFALAAYPGLPPNCVVCDGTTLALLVGGKLNYFRTSDIPLTATTISSALSALELSGQSLPSQLYLTGAAADDAYGYADSVPLVVETLRAPVDVDCLFKNEETFNQLAGLYAVARASHSGQLPDFRKGELACTAVNAGLRRKLLLCGILASIAVFLLFTHTLLRYRAVTAELASVNKSVAGIYREVFPARAKAVDEISEIKGEIRKLAGIEAGGSSLDLLKKLAEAKGDGINGLLEAELDGRTLRVKGDARSTQAVNEFKTALVPLLAGVELSELKSRPDGSVAFRLSGTVKEEGK